MKKTLTIMFLFLGSNLCFSQHSNNYKIDEEIGITFIELEISPGNIYRVFEKKILIKIRLHRLNDSISYIKEFYTNDKKNDTVFDFRNPDLGRKIKTILFDEIVSKLSKLNIEKINSSKDFNIFDGQDYRLKFSNTIYTISVSTNSPDMGTKERGLTDFLDLCKSIWELGKTQ